MTHFFILLINLCSIYIEAASPWASVILNLVSILYLPPMKLHRDVIA